ncbi:SGNH/GDSL hydrolase family protein [Lactobacillus sp. ESL0791]|uniref:SGNH/GDSL hydrolase family protein n=1 Tax=Lactobacillus sp. ESL0791 TaxID=2983234 RepID=UPI0023F79EC7|nr:SGNH/GDSL hydrolase family protein [Lactobacillus sp. ESL0791]MDF7639523.1 SGNH/GDSL hydrolase family protein [Lactobacillus sp. ESL0791]
MKKIILFGDSIFNGYRYGEDTNLVTIGMQEALGSGVQIENLSKSGATTTEGLNYLGQIDPRADLVVLEYGTNDAASSWGIPSNTYAQNLATMIKTIGASRMIIVGPSYPDPNNKEIMQFYSTDRLNLYNRIAKNQAQKNSIPFVDLIAHWRKLSDVSSYYQKDGQHLLDQGNAELIAQVAGVIKEKIEQ